MTVGFLFDNDGVLMNSSDLHWMAWQLLMQEDPALEMSETMYIQGHGKRNDLILKDAVPKASEAARLGWAKRKEELFREKAKGRIQLLEGMETFLKKVKAASIPRIIASSTPKENLQMYVSTTVLGDYFDQFVSADEVDHGKPFPDVFLEAAHRLNIPPERCIVFEDAPAGLQAAKMAGCFAVALCTTHRASELSGYDLIYPSAKELDLETILEAFGVWAN